MLRRIVRDGIRAVARGRDPYGTRWPEGKTIPTFTQDVVLRVPRGECGGGSAAAASDGALGDRERRS